VQTAGTQPLHDIGNKLTKLSCSDWLCTNQITAVPIRILAVRRSKLVVPLMTSPCTGLSVYSLPGTMSSIVECYPAGRNVSGVAVAVIVADDQHNRKKPTHPADPVTSRRLLAAVSACDTTSNMAVSVE